MEDNFILEMKENLEDLNLPTHEKIILLKNFFETNLNPKFQNEVTKLILNLVKVLFGLQKIDELGLVFEIINFDKIKAEELKEIKLKWLRINGELQEESRLTNELLMECVEHKHFSRGLNLLTESARLISAEEFYTYKLIFLTQRGDYQKISEATEFNFILERYLAGIPLFKNSFDETLERFMVYEDIDLGHNETPLILFGLKSKFLLNKLSLKLKIGEETIQERELIINAIYKRIIQDSGEVTLYYLLAEYAFIIGRRKILLSIKAVSLDREEKLKERIFIYNLMRTKISQLSKIKDDPLNESQIDLDLENLLFSSNESKKIERPAKATEHLPFYLKEKDFKDERLNRALLKSCEFLSEEELQCYLKDIVVCFIFLQSFDAALGFLDLIKSKINFTIEQEIEVAYLKSEILIRMENYKSVFTVAEMAIQEFPLNDEEMLNFYYLMANANVKLGFKTEGLQMYKRISKKRPYYRSVKWRIRDIENI